MIQSGHQNLSNPVFFSDLVERTNQPYYVYDMVSEIYGLSPTKPVVNAEALYEKPLRDTDYAMRNDAYLSVFSGALGHTYGTGAVYGFKSAQEPCPSDYEQGLCHEWKVAMDYPGAFDMKHLKELMLSRPFFTRIPDQSVISSSQGSSYDRTQAARSSDGSYSLVYLTTGDSVTADMSKISGTVKAWWYNPRDGTSTLIGEFANTGSRSFTPPSSGYGNDWILVLDDKSKGFCAPGTCNVGS